MEFLFQGAESKIFVDNDKVIKERLHKSYRIPELDAKIVKSRTKREAKIMSKLLNGNINVPKVYLVKENKIIMERIFGKTVKELIEDSSDPTDVFFKLGKLVADIHNLDVVHGDLTTSNFMFFENNLFVIDFGLSYVSTKDEDKAVDLYVFDRAVNCAHDSGYLNSFYEGYKLNGKEEVLKKLESVRQRGRKREETMIG